MPTMECPYVLVIFVTVDLCGGESPEVLGPQEPQEVSAVTSYVKTSSVGGLQTCRPQRITDLRYYLDSSLSMALREVFASEVSNDTNAKLRESMRTTRNICRDELPYPPLNLTTCSLDWLRSTHLHDASVQRTRLDCNLRRTANAQLKEVVKKPRYNMLRYVE